MIKDSLGKYQIRYEDFNNLLLEYSWLLHKRMKDNWTPNDHLEYIDNIVHCNPFGVVEFYVDSNISKDVRTIDVFIMPSELDKTIDSKTYHIQFVKDHRETRN